MPLTRPSNLLKNKSNPIPVGNRLEEATAEDFIEISNLLNEYADQIEATSGSTAAKTSVGTYPSLAALSAAIPVGQVDEYAIIEPVAGATLFIALWNDVSQQWEFQEDTSPTIYVANYAGLPVPGVEGSFYITLDKYNFYAYKNAEYHHLNKREGDLIIEDEGGKKWYVQKDLYNEDPDPDAIQQNDICSGYTDNTKTRYVRFKILQLPVIWNDPASSKVFVNEIFE